MYIQILAFERTWVYLNSTTLSEINQMNKTKSDEGNQISCDFTYM